MQVYTEVYGNQVYCSTVKYKNANLFCFFFFCLFIYLYILFFFCVTFMNYHRAHQKVGGIFVSLRSPLFLRVQQKSFSYNNKRALHLHLLVMVGFDTQAYFRDSGGIVKIIKKYHSYRSL